MGATAAGDGDMAEVLLVLEPGPHQPPWQLLLMPSISYGHLCPPTPSPVLLPSYGAPQTSAPSSLDRCEPHLELTEVQTCFAICMRTWKKFQCHCLFQTCCVDHELCQVM